MLLRTLARQFLRHLPLLLVIAIALFIAAKNIDPKTTYSGWDNIHAEFDLGRYARQVFFGAWIEHQGMGAPAAQGHLSEIPRLPILFLLKLFLPANLIRYVFIFAMYLIGGIGMYLYLAKHWIKPIVGNSKYWLAGLGAVLYLLHILTLQQFYISFEMFMVQFAFLPFLLIVIHQLTQKITIRTTLLFIAIQLLIAPSGHTPTVFYLAVLFSQLYGFCINLPKGLLKAIWMGFLIGFLTLLVNAYWILPNLYYTANDAQYVQESRDNQLFGSESVWSIREAGTISNLLKGTHYLMGWKDYSIENKQFDLIFNEWQTHLAKPEVNVLLHLFGVMTVTGAIIIGLDGKKGAKRWAILAVYIFCLVFIWIDLFPTDFILDKLYQSGSFLEAFRNPFTKLSIIYSFVSILLFVQFFEFVSLRLSQRSLLFIQGSKLAGLCIAVTIGGIMYSALPSFQGHFISEKLKVIYPSEYAEMSAYLRTRDRNLRILPLPQLSHAGWEYFDWPFERKGNGYQGMGFYFFETPQPVLHRDSDRWIETSDFFYHELKHALDTQDTDRFKNILEKYHVDLIIVDETKFDPTRKHDYAMDHRMANEAGLEKVWTKDFLTIYERNSIDKDQAILSPEKITFVSASTKRVSTDFVYQQEGDYALVADQEAQLFYPFSQLAQKEISAVKYTEKGTEISQNVPAGTYTLTLPGFNDSHYLTPAAVHYHDQVVDVTFPKDSLSFGTQEITLPTLLDFQFKVEKDFPSILIVFNNGAVIVDQDKTVYPIIDLPIDKPLSVYYTSTPADIKRTANGDIDGSQLKTVLAQTLLPDWRRIKEPIMLQTGEIKNVTIHSEFPVIAVDLLQNPPLNCATPAQGKINTKVTGNKVIYQADGFAVNCNGYDFGTISSAYPYIMNIAGKNVQGRGVKFFVNYAHPEVLPEDYLFHTKEFDSTVTLPATSADNSSPFYLNWETRSFGKKNIVELDSVKIAPFPLDQMAQLRLEQTSSPSMHKNNLKVISGRTLFDSVHLIDVQCPEKRCFFELDQSYDDLWLGFQKGHSGFLPHYRLNNWSNMWEVSESGRVFVIYLPELIALSSFALLIIGTTILLFLFFRLQSSRKTSRPHKLIQKTRRKLRPSYT
jgi:hypothetical protein